VADDLRPLLASPPAPRAKGTTQELVRRLEAELGATKLEQHRLIVQLQNSKEELKAANEEVLSMNEELQSTNEELVTSKEELQSMNEELTTLNRQLQEKLTTLKKTEEELTAARERVSADLRRMIRLYEVSTRLAGQGDVTSLLDEIVAAASENTSAVMGMIQVVNDTGGLTVAAQTGFEAPFLEVFQRVDASTDGAYATALASGQRVIVDDVTQDAMVRDSPSLNVLLAAGVRGVQLTPLISTSGALVGMLSTYYRTSPPLGDADLRWLDLMACQAVALLERRRLEDVRAKAGDELERRVTERTKWLRLMHDVGRAIDEAPNWKEALRLVMRQICEAEDWQVGYVYLPASDAGDQLTAVVGYSSDGRFLPFHAASQQARHRLEHSLLGRVFEDGHHVWVNDQDELLKLMKLLPVRAAVAMQVGLRSAVALPVRIGNETLAVVELCSDRPHPERDELVDLMRDVSTQVGRVIERERMMAQVGEIIWGEQQDLVHTLHDALGQQLTGLGMLATSLNQRLRDTDTESARTAQQIASTAQEALERVRQLSRGLFPSDIDGNGFVAALRQLASTTESLHKIPCSVACETAIAIPNSHVATQLYRIAQEAVTNALRHADAEHITIQLNADGGTTTLRVIDDGVGIHHRVPAENGIGLRIMRHRAMSMGAGFSVGPATDRGTVVTCTLPEALQVRS
jgi:signal transduction histidine kinase